MLFEKLEKTLADQLTNLLYKEGDYNYIMQVNIKHNISYLRVHYNH